MSDNELLDAARALASAVITYVDQTPRPDLSSIHRPARYLVSLIEKIDKEKEPKTPQQEFDRASAQYSFLLEKRKVAVDKVMRSYEAEIDAAWILVARTEKALQEDRLRARGFLHDPPREEKR